MHGDRAPDDHELPSQHRPGTPGDPLDPEEGSFDWSRNPLDRAGDAIRGVDHAGEDRPREVEEIRREEEEPHGERGQMPPGEDVGRPGA